MIRSQVRAQVAANQPEAAKSDAGLGGQAVKAAEIPAPEIDRPAVIAGRPSPSWLVRNPRKAALAMVVIAIAAAPFAFRYLQREFGPDPLVGIKLDDVKPALSAAPFIEPAPKPLPPRPAVAPARPVVAAPVAAVPMAPSPGVTPSLGVSPSSGVTHTRPGGAVQAGPEAPAATVANRDRPEKSAGPRAGARAEATGSGACSEAVAALGLCNPNATEKGK